MRRRFTDVELNTRTSDSERQRGLAWDANLRPGESHSSERLLSADADAVAAPAAPATLHQAFRRARTVVDGQPLGLPG